MDPGFMTNGSLRKTQRRKIILSVEDDESLRLLLSEELTHEGYNVDSASDGIEGVRKFEERLISGCSYDLVITDIRMPNMDGLEMLHRIVYLSNDTPVIIYSAYPHYREDFSTWLAHAYLVKSMDFGELLVTVKHLFGECD